MGAPSAGAVVLVRFPFSDLSQTKLRPAVVLAESGRGDWILCQVTSKSYGDVRAIKLENADFPQDRFESRVMPVLVNFSRQIKSWLSAMSQN